MSDASSDSTLVPPPSAAAEQAFPMLATRSKEPLRPLAWKRPLTLFGLTVASIVMTGGEYEAPPDVHPLLHGLWFAVPLLAILLAHEFGHFFFARRHGVNASLPFFIPLPLLSPFGTMGAVIVMRDRIKSRNALLDIGASGPLAGMLLAIPVFVAGLRSSIVLPTDRPLSSVWSGVSLLSWGLQRLVVGPIPDGYDVVLGPMAVAGWAGMFVTMLNLLPVGQLDGGHVAYAIFGPKQNVYSTRVRWTILLFAPLNVAVGLWAAGRAGLEGPQLGHALVSGLPWMTWFVVLSILGRVSGGQHPPTDAGELSPGRRVIAIGTLALFALLFMPMPSIF